VSTRKLAPGVTAPPRRRKPSKGAEAYVARRQALRDAEARQTAVAEPATAEPGSAQSAVEEVPGER